MTPTASCRCCVCGATDARALVDVALAGGAATTVCGSHALMARRAGPAAQAQTETELRALLRDRRGRRDPREDHDELGTALVAAFHDERRAADRRRNANNANAGSVTNERHSIVPAQYDAIGRGSGGA
jgi:hypothetical protein